MSFNIEVRKKQLLSLNQYINSSKHKVDSILNYLGWTGKNVLENKDKISCPLNTKHRVPIEKIEIHVQKCRLFSSGYDSNSEFLSEPPAPSASSLLLDVPKKIEILNEARLLNPKFRPAWNGLEPDPMTADRNFSTFSTDERLALYDYSINNTQGPPPPSEFLMNGDDSNTKTEPLTKEERLQQERNAKRRPIKHKSVHTGRNKNHTEVMREVIQNQMELLKEHIKEKERAIEEAEQKRQQELIEKAQAYEQFPHIDSNVVYDYGIDPFDVSENSYLENVNGNVSFNVNYDYNMEIPVKLEQDCIETTKDVNNHLDRDHVEKRDDHRSRPSSRQLHRDRDRRPRSRDRDYKRNSERRSRESREYHSRRRESYHRSERRH